MEKVSLDIHQREIILMPFPYSDLSGKKVRPVIVVSNDTFNSSSQDLIVCGITSNISKDHYTISLKKDCLEKGSLLDNCCIASVGNNRTSKRSRYTSERSDKSTNHSFAQYIKVENIAKIDRSLVIKKIGSLKKDIFSDVVLHLDALFR